MAKIEKKTKRYPSDLMDEEWEQIKLLLPKPAKKGCKPKGYLREILNAIRYMARSGDYEQRIVSKAITTSPWEVFFSGTLPLKCILKRTLTACDV